MATPLDPLCPSIQAALELLGRPWTGLVLAVLQDGALRYSELSTRIPGIGDKTLCVRLKELETRGLVVREVEPGPPVRVAYRLTPKGAGFRRVVEAIDAWGREFREPAKTPNTKAPSTKAPSTKAPSTKAPAAKRTGSPSPGATSRGAAGARREAVGAQARREAGGKRTSRAPRRGGGR